MSEHIHKSHNVTVLMYHLVFPATYRRAAIDDDGDEVLKETCIEIEKRYQMKVLEIGMLRSTARQVSERLGFPRNPKEDRLRPAAAVSNP